MKKETIFSDATHLYYYFWGDSCGGNFDAFIPLGQYDTKAITYTVNGEEKDPNSSGSDSFRYVLDENGDKVTQAAPLFGTESVGGRGGILNYVFEGLTTGDKSSGAVGIIAFILVVGRCLWRCSADRCH